jgi:hypothetical protein
MPEVQERDRDEVRGELDELRERVRELERARLSGRRWRAGAMACVVVLGASLARAQLVTFQADQPALASEVNGNFTQLRTWLETKLGTATSPEVRMFTTTGNPVLFATANTATNTAPIADFRHNNLTQGIGIGWDGLMATGTATNQSIQLTPKGNGTVLINGAARVSGTLDIGLELITCTNVPSGSDCTCPSGKRALSGGAYCNGNNWHVNTAYFSSSTAFQAWCEDSAGTNVATTINVLCARVL